MKFATTLVFSTSDHRHDTVMIWKWKILHADILFLLPFRWGHLMNLADRFSPRQEIVVKIWKFCLPESTFPDDMFLIVGEVWNDKPCVSRADELVPVVGGWIPPSEVGQSGSIVDWIHFKEGRTGSVRSSPTWHHHHEAHQAGSYNIIWIFPSNYC